MSHIPLQKHIAKVLQIVGGCTFGIYLFSDLVIEKTGFVFENLCMSGIHPLPAVFVYEVVVFGVGLVITYILKLVPGIKKLF